MHMNRICIVSGTNRENSNTFKIAKIVESFYLQMRLNVDFIDLRTFPLQELTGQEYFKNKPTEINRINELVVSADGLVVITPEYNGGFPGILKMFIDHLKFPESFQFRPVCFVGLGDGMWGGLRPVEHLQQIFNYREALLFPTRVFLRHVSKLWQADKLADDEFKRLQLQAEGFAEYVKILTASNFTATTRTIKTT